MKKKRIVVKIGSSSLTNSVGGLSKAKLIEHVTSIVRLKQLGHDVILISSGAVAAGFTGLGYPSRPVTIKGKQAAAAVGQGLLMQGYAEEFKKANIVTAQLLLTRNDFSKKEQHSNAYATISELIERSVIPIINENDSVSVEELTFGDNDMLSALVSGLVHADFLIILTDVNGLYNQNPKQNPTAKKYYYLPAISDDILALTNSSQSKFGTGGMKSKIDAAKLALSLGVNVFIGIGEGSTKLIDILDGKGDGTYIGNSLNNPIKNSKQWIAVHSPISGQIGIDAGASTALLYQGKSLLPAGITSVQGNFIAGQVVEVINHKENVIGKGQVNYSAAELLLIKGKQSHEAMQQTNRQDSEIIHRNNWISMVDPLYRREQRR